MMREAQDPRAWRRTTALRLGMLAVLFATFVVAVVVRLVWVQTVHRAFYVAASKDQVLSTQPLVAPRGDIVDRNGRVLAMSVDAVTVKAEAFRIEGPARARVAAALCGALADCGPGDEASLVKRLASGRYINIARQVNDAQARRVKALKIDGIYFADEPHRWYPNKELAAQVLGFAGADADGLAGLERRYDALLRGTDGKVMLELGGGKTTRKPFSRVVIKPEVPGRTLELTIDANLQYLAERELQAAVAENKAKGGSIVVLDPATGEILAMASCPTVNANEFGRGSQEERTNRPVEVTYEPGSTFKIVTATAALDGKVWSPDDLIDTGDGTYRIGSRRPITEAHQVRYGTLSFTDVLVKSSNIGAILIGRRIGAPLLGTYIDRFGFGTCVAPDFRPVESAGIVRPGDWSESRLASVSMGYEIGVTALQMVVAASVVANGGELVQPRVIRAVIDGNRRDLVPRKVVRRVMTPETAAALTTIMEEVVTRGTGGRAVVKNFTVAGKTGTSNKNENNRYINDYNTSFVGFVPSRKPVMAIVVHIDTPRGPNKPFGGTVAAPVFGRLAEAALCYLGVPPTVDPPLPVLVARRDGVGQVSEPSSPAPVTIVPALAPIAAGQVVLPDVRGMSLREALRVLGRIGITPRVTGDGIVVEQDPAPGTPIDFGAACRLALARAIPGTQP
jgi:cell division protein FtsI (penicillin-binding protein 3)